MKKHLLFILILCQIHVFGQGIFLAGGNVTPSVTTQAVTSIGSTTATGNGTVLRIGYPPISVRGSCWNTSTNPTTANSKTTDGSTVGSFTSALTSLTFGSTYYVRAYVTNSISTYYGDNVNFVVGTLPTVTTTAITDLVNSGGNVTSDGGGTVTARGVCWNTAGAPTTADSKTTDGSGTGVFTSTLSGLSEGNIYYVRAYATNAIGTAYGSQLSLNIPASIPGMGKLYNWYAVSGTGTGSIANTGWHIPTYTELDTLRLRLDPSGSGNNNIAGNKMKSTGTTYWPSPNSDATNSSGFNARAAGIRNYLGAFSGHPMSLYNGYVFYACSNSLGTTTTYAGAVRDWMSAFEVVASTSYYKKQGFSVRLICDSSTDPGSYTGNDGKTYSTVKIGNQVWISSNLRETKYRDGTDIPQVTSSSAWAALTTGAFCWYNNNSGYE